jgi:pantothenate kinase type III
MSTSVIFKNAGILGITLTPAIQTSINTLDAQLATKTNNTDFNAYKTLTGTAVQALDTKVNDQIANLNSLGAEILRVRDLLATATTVTNLSWSSPPTQPEKDAINALAIGSFYTINGGNVIMVHRAQNELL